MLQLKKFPDIPVSTREEARGSRPHPEEPRFRLVARDEGSFPCFVGKEFPPFPSHLKRTRSPQERREELQRRDTAATAREESPRACPLSSQGLTPLGRLQKYPKIHVSASRGGALHRIGERNSRVVPPFQESPRCLSPFQRNLFSLHCLDFHAEDRLPPRWHVGQPCGKASWESHRSPDPGDGKRDTAATALEESVRASPHSRRGLTPLGRPQKYPQDPCQHWRGILRFRT